MTGALGRMRLEPMGRTWPEPKGMPIRSATRARPESIEQAELIGVHTTRERKANQTVTSNYNQRLYKRLKASKSMEKGWQQWNNYLGDSS